MSRKGPPIGVNAIGIACKGMLDFVEDCVEKLVTFMLTLQSSLLVILLEGSEYQAKKSCSETLYHLNSGKLKVRYLDVSGISKFGDRQMTILMFQVKQEEGAEVFDEAEPMEVVQEQGHEEDEED